MFRAGVLISLLFLVWSVAAESRSVWDGAYTKAQATRGQAIYRQECARCHGENLLGGDDAPAVVGEDFLEQWKGKTVGGLFEVIRKTMPTDGPGVLSRRQCSDITAYMLSANEFPAGTKELDTEDAPLNEIRIEPKK